MLNRDLVVCGTTARAKRAHVPCDARRWMFGVEAFAVNALADQILSAAIVNRDATQAVQDVLFGPTALSRRAAGHLSAMRVMAILDRRAELVAGPNQPAGMIELVGPVRSDVSRVDLPDQRAGIIMN